MATEKKTTGNTENLNIVEQLLQQYEPEKAKTQARATIEKRKERLAKGAIATESYANPYDKLYDTYAATKNFNPSLYQDAIKFGEQDQLFTLLEKSKDTQLSEQFYDPQYYDYQTMMLELYKPFADDENLTDRTHEVYDESTGEWVTESIGQMTDRQWIDYQVKQAHDIRALEITRQLELEKKEAMSFMQKFGHDVLATGAELGEGALSALTGFADVLAAPLYATEQKIEGEQWGDAFVDFIANEGMLAAEKKSVRIALDEYERTHTHFRDIDGNYTSVGKYAAGIANSIGMMIPSIVATALTGGAASFSWVGQATFYASIFTGNVYEAATNPATANAPAWTMIGNAAVKAGVEVLIEHTLNKFLGGTIQNDLIGLSGGAKGLTNVLGKEVTKKGLAVASLKYIGKSAAQEGLEEFLQDFSTNLVDQFMDMYWKGYGNNGVNGQTLVDSFVMGALSSLFLSGGAMMKNRIDRTTKNISERRKSKGEIRDAGETYVELSDGTLKKLNAFEHLYFDNLLSNFNSAIDTLRRKSLKGKNVIKLAQETQAAFGVLSQFYASIGEERVKSAELLLNHVIERESRLLEREYAKKHAAEDLTAIDELDEGYSTGVDRNALIDRIAEGEEARAYAQGERQKAVNTYIMGLTLNLNSMVGGAKTRVAERAKKVLEKNEEELKKNDVTTTTGAVDKNGESYTIGDIDKQLRGKKREKATQTLSELAKGGYEWVFTTDGHIAIDEDNMLFVSEDWVENYTADQIREFLVQSDVIKMLLDKKSPLVAQKIIKKLVAFHKSFTNRKDVDDERALMDFLFNESVFKAFLLREGGKNLHEFKNIVFRIFDMIKDAATSSKYLKLEGKTLAEVEKRKKVLQDVLAKIQKTWRRPTILAILHWNMKAQEIGADRILTAKTDRDFIKRIENARQAHKDAAKPGTRVSSDYRRHADDIVEIIPSYVDNELGKQIHEAIERGLAPNATNNQRLEAVALLDLFEREDEYFFNGLMNDIIEHQAFALTVPVTNCKFSDFADLELVTDKFREFEQKFGSTPNEMLHNGISSRLGSEYHRNIITAMEILSINEIISEPSDDSFTDRFSIVTEKSGTSMSVSDFVCRELEQMLGDNYIVTLDREYNLVVAKRISASHFLPDKILKTNLDEQNAILQEILGKDNEIYLTDIFSLDELSRYFTKGVIERLHTCKIYLTDESGRGRYNLEKNVIYISRDANNIFDVLVHETNHAIQYASGMSRGASQRLIGDNTRLLRYVFKTFPLLYKTHAQIRGLSTSNLMIDDILNNLDDDRPFQILRYITYLLVTGEVLARAGTHNVSVQGINNFGRFQTSDGSVYDEDLSISMDAMPPRFQEAVAATSLKESFLNTLRGREVTNQGRKKEYYRNTYHSSLTKYSGQEIINALVDPALPFFQKYVTLNTLIEQYDVYLSPEILSQMPNISKDNAHYLIRSYIEKHFDGVSIDRSADTHQWVLVDDDAFDDLYRAEIKSQNGAEKTLVQKYNLKDTSLAEFFDAQTLENLGIDPDISVYCDLEVDTEFVYDEYNPEGVIYIQTSPNMTNAEFVDALSHEFRHLMQYYSKLETGFTADFKVSNEMLEDVKSHVPEIYEDKEVKTLYTRILKRELGRAPTVKELEVCITQRFIYSFVSGELNAYGIEANMLFGKPVYVTTDGGFPTIFMPWYDRKTGKGRYKTEFLAARKMNDKIKTSKKDKKDTTEVSGTKEKSVETEKITKDTKIKLIIDVIKHESIQVYLDQYDLDTPSGQKEWEQANSLLQKSNFIEDLTALRKKKVNKETLSDGEKTRLKTLEKLAPVYAEILRNSVQEMEKLKSLSDSELEEKYQHALTVSNRKTDALKIPWESFPKSKKYTTGKLYQGKTRLVTRKRAEGTNLMYFVKKGEQIQMDPALQDFIIATTDHDDEIPDSLFHWIKKGVLTKQMLFQWLTDVDLEEINDFTFKLINRYFFDNDYFKNTAQFSSALEMDPEEFWAMALVFAERGVPIQSFLEENDLNSFKQFLDAPKGKVWREAIFAKREEFVKINIDPTGSGVPKHIDAVLSDDILRQVRLLTFKYFDGTLAGAFRVGHGLREYLIQQHEARARIEHSSDTKKGGNTVRGDKEQDFYETYRAEDDEEAYEFIGSNTDDSYVRGDSIIKAYLVDKMNDIVEKRFVLKSSHFAVEVEKYLGKLSGVSDKFKAWIKDQLLLAYETQGGSLGEALRNAKNERDRKNLNVVAQRYADLMTRHEKFIQKITYMTDEEIVEMYDKWEQDDLLNNVSLRTFAMLKTETSNEKFSTKLVNVRGRAKRAGNTLSDALNSGEISIDDVLLMSVRDFFEIVEADDRSGKKIWKLNPKTYRVGKGKVAMQSVTGEALFYTPKQNILNKKSQKHDTTQVVKNAALLKEAVELLKAKRRHDKEVAEAAERRMKKTERDNAIKEARINRTQKELDAAREKLKNTKEELKQTRITLKNLKRKAGTRSDVPTTFNIISATELPDVLRQLFQYSFESFADTKVQFASIDETTGEHYTKKWKETHESEFKSRVQHEVANWEQFFDANYELLHSLTRQDVVLILDTLRQGIAAFGNGLQNKLNAIQIFLLGYIWDAAESNTFDWNFSADEVDDIRVQFEAQASALGSGLNAVKQVRDVINPIKRVSQRQFKEFGLTDEDTERLFNVFGQWQRAETRTQRQEAEISLSVELDRIEQIMATAKETRAPGTLYEKGPLRKRLWSALKRYRYTSMLSNPATWVRNKVSNAVISQTTKLADVFGKIIFKEGDYREDQWDLARVQVSGEVRNFIEQEVKNGKIFELLYTEGSKYDDKKRKGGSTFGKLLVKSLSEKFIQQGRTLPERFITRMISDKDFVERATRKYFGKILTLEIKSGNIDLSNGMTDKVLNLFADALILANDDYMHKRSAITDLIDRGAERHPKLREALYFWQPFLNSGFNWFSEAWKYTPIGLVNAIYRSRNLEAQITKMQEKRKRGETVPNNRLTQYLIARDFGKGILGTLLTAAGVLLVLTGAFKLDDEEDKFYLRFGDLKIDITEIFGTSSLLMGASLAQIFVTLSDNENDNSDDIIERMFSTFTEYLFEGFILTDLLERHDYDRGAWEHLLTETESVFRSFVPQAWQLMGRIINNEKIKTHSGIRGMFERTVNSIWPAALGDSTVNPYTGELQSRNALPVWGELLKSGILAGARFYWVPMSETEELVQTYGVNKKELTGQITVNDKKYQLDTIKLNQKYGELNSKTLPALQSQRHYVQMPDNTYRTLSWNDMSDKQRANVIERTTNENAQTAKVWAWTEAGHRYYTTKSEWLELRKLGITKNVYLGDKGFVE